MFRKYILNVLVSIDQLINTIFFGDPDETISSRVGKHYPDTLLAKVINTIFFWEKNHVKSHIEEDEGKDSIFGD